METDETLNGLLSENDAIKRLVEDFDLEIKKKSLLECFDDILEYARVESDNLRHYDCYYRFNESLMNAKEVELNVIAKAYGLTNTQAALLALMVELCKGGDVNRENITEQLQIKYVSFLSYEKDLVVLQKKKLIKKCRWGNLKVAPEVLDALAAGKAYHMPSTDGLTTGIILSRMTRLFNSLRSGDENIKMALSEIDELFLSNPHTSIAKTADDYGIVKIGDVYDTDEKDDDSIDLVSSMNKNERTLFYALLYRYHDMTDDDCGWWDFKDYYEPEDLDSIQEKYKEQELTLQKKNVIEFVCVDGMVVKDRFHLTDEIKEKLLADAGGLHDRTPVAGMVLNNTISDKKLFYDCTAQKQVDSLECLLSEVKFNDVRTSLKSNGLRSGFTCLFYGGPGTGKTETVYQLARKTGRDLLFADVTKLKSCWVGESEKNVKNLFNRYRRCVRESKVTPILLFNEADSIFGLRKEGAEAAVDKMENSIQNIILQEMETLDGILIATTNLTQNLDKAFERRFLYKVKFDVPSVEVKSKIWHSMMPELSESQTLKLSSKFDFSGGQIENISRKSVIQTIVSGLKPSFEDIISYCNEELIDTPNRSCRIGF